MSPAAVTAALAPALAEVAPALRTTVARQNGRASARSRSMVSKISMRAMAQSLSNAPSSAARLSRVLAGRKASRCGSAAAMPAATGA